MADAAQDQLGFPYHPRLLEIGETWVEPCPSPGHRMRDLSESAWRVRFTTRALAWLFIIGLHPSHCLMAQPDMDQLTPRTADLLASNCYVCHSGDEPESGLNLAGFQSISQIRAAGDTWQKVLWRVRSGSMPPPEMDPLVDDDRAWLSDWIQRTLHDIDCSAVTSAGTVTIRRLNRREYRNSIRDLLLVDYEPAAAFPGDDAGYGFDNIGDVLSLPPVLMEKYLDAAEVISRRAIQAPEDLLPMETELKLDTVRTSRGVRLEPHQIVFFSNGGATFNVTSPGTQNVVLRIRALGQQAGDEPCKMSLFIDGDRFEQFEIARRGVTETIEREVQLEEGDRTIQLTFDNDYYQSEAEDPNERDRNLFVQLVSIIRLPDLKQPPSEAHANFFAAGQKADLREGTMARHLLSQWGSRLFRRPCTEQESTRLFAIYTGARRDGSSFEQALQFGLQAILVSPKFLYKIEQPPPHDGTPRDLNNFELATSLAYFLWQSAPDVGLLHTAMHENLQNREVLHREVRRLIADPRADRMIDSFATQWLQLEALARMQPDPARFPGVDSELLDDMRAETTAFVRDVFRSDLSLLTTLSADFTWINGRLAEHYGFEEVSSSDQFVRVSLDGSGRSGLLTQASILTVTSNPTRTSPVKRGKWVLENVLAESPPPALPDVMPLEQQRLTGTLRQRMEQHREDASCAVCHDQMDPLGFALEHFDAVGRWRDTDEDAPIDASGRLPSGESFEDVQELVEILIRDKKQQFLRCITEKMLTFALGRGLRYEDQCTVNAILKRLAANGDRASELVMGIVESDPFRKRQSAQGESTVTVPDRNK